ncbi:Short-chain dehydrogenase [Pseudonocardia ammonioxydans]|uniref:Short-chain dehydrogenase n=1 Tax=Pseudonocardia ammonioxydans TaxID=260086 RepID=A0A1I5AA84_PSUAM|nr:SDR family NAD(P)-dependent oxidoreductase [Pseudonocardia ammonioxydans]SFN59323.1 Short-chain dehydrogenase [Pseudonocardia ammonioxydans]
MSTWFVTGASRGLGAEIARAALDRGDAVVVTARDTDALPADLRAHPRTVPVALDVTDGAAIAHAVEIAVEEFGGIDVLVNNAGRGLLGAVEEVTDAEARSLFDLNVFGLIAMTRAVLPHMRRAGRGTLVHVGSRSGYEGEPGVGLYCASKFAVAGIGEALASELEPFGIRSMVVEPGVLRTDFLDRSSLSLPARRIADYDGTPAHVTLDWVDEANHTQLGDPVRSAELIVAAATSEAPPRRLPIGPDAVERLEVTLARMGAELEPWRARSQGTAFETV